MHTKFEFLIAFSVVIVVIIIVIILRCIPKSKLPYCLGGNKGMEGFVCPDRWKDYCKQNGIKNKLSNEEIANCNSFDEVMEKNNNK
jgi:hypothetical protein